MGGMELRFHSMFLARFSSHTKYRPQMVKYTTVNTVPVYSMSELEDYLRTRPVDVVVLTIPQSVAQVTADRLIGLGVKGFWNFTNIELSSADPSVQFENIHFADSLLTLSYRIANR